MIIVSMYLSRVWSSIFVQDAFVDDITLVSFLSRVVHQTEPDRRPVKNQLKDRGPDRSKVVPDRDWAGENLDRIALDRIAN